MSRIAKDDGPLIPEGLSDLLVAFLKECLHNDPVRRPSAKKLSRHEWLNWSLNRVRESELVGFRFLRKRERSRMRMYG
jgi:hypothetical protein